MTLGGPPNLDKEFRLPSGRRVDLVFTNKRAKSYLAVELKRDIPPYGPWVQLAEYVLEMPPLAKAGDYTVSGLLITGAAPPVAVEAFEAAELADIQWVTYDIRATFPAVSMPLITTERAD